MRFENPQFLWLLLLGPALLVFLGWAERARRRLMTRFIQARLLPGLLVDVSPARRKLRAGLLALATLLLALVLARPQWGFHLEEVRQRGLDIVVALDTSRSMVAADVAPNRLARAKLEALALKQLCRTDRMGLVAFAGTAFLQCPLTLDDDAFRLSLEALDTAIIPQGGTALAEAIRTALAAFKEKTDNHKILVLLTDGEDHDGQAVEAATEAARQGMRIFTVGVGTPNGDLLKTNDARGQPVFIKDADGNVVKSRLNESLLREIATVANGFYLPLTGARTMDTLYQQGLAPLPKSDSEVKTTRRYHERFQWFLGLALMLLLAEMFVPDAKPAPRLARRDRKAVALAALLFAGLAGPVGAATAPAGRLKVQPAEEAPSLEQLRQERLQAQRQREYQRQIDRYEQRLQKHPDDARLYFNKGTLESELGAWAEAEQDLQRALNTPDLRLQSRAYYNLGNTLYHRGENEPDPAKKKQAWQQATNAYAHALQLDPKDEDARYNFELVGKKIAALPQPPPQPQNQDKKQDQNQDKQDQSKQDQQDQNKQNDPQPQPQQQNQGQDQQKQDDQQSQQQPNQQEQSQGEQKQNSPQPQQGGQKQEGEPKDDEPDASPAGKLLPMTPQQARQLLDTLKNEERTLIFTPPLKTNRMDRLFKDW